MTETRCGYIAIVGRPNVGKSTLLNRLLGQKLSITSRKPQTTRHSLLGIKTDAAVQYIYVDTPGLQDNVKKTVNRYMNRTAEAVLADVDVVLFVVEAARWTAADRYVLERLQHCGAPVITVLNKADKLSAKAEVLPAIEQLHSLIANEFPDIGATEIVPVAALHGTHLDELEVLIAGHLPEGDFFFPDDQITDRSERFLVSEIVREKIMRQLGQELPYEVAVEIEEFKRKQKMLHISAVIHVERDGQKPIIIGRQGQRLKKIGSDARVDIEQLLQEKVMLRLWVKVKAGWSNDERYLKSLGLQGADK